MVSMVLIHLLLTNLKNRFSEWRNHRLSLYVELPKTNLRP